MIDKWEAELARGITPDLTEGYSEERLRALEKDKVRVQRARALQNQLTNIDNKLQTSVEEDSRYKTRTIEELKGKLLGG